MAAFLVKVMEMMAMTRAIQESVSQYIMSEVKKKTFSAGAKNMEAAIR